MTWTEGWFAHRRRVGWVDTDPSGAYQFTAALRYVEEAEVAMLRDLGIRDLLYPRLPRRSVRADYHRPLRFDDDIDVRIRVRSLGRTSIDYEFRLGDVDGEICADGGLTAVLVGSDGRPQTLPDAVRTVLAAECAHALKDTVHVSS